MSDRGWAGVWARKGLMASSLSSSLSPPPLATLLSADGFDTATGAVDEAAWRRRAADIARRLDLGDVDGGATVLEVGCGAGAMLWALQETLPGLRLVGVDPAESLLALARLALPAGRFVAGTAQRIPCADASCDGVFAHSVFAYFDRLGDVDVAVAELVRVARPQAAIGILDVPDLARRDACEAERARLVGSTPAGRGGLHHLYVPRARLVELGRAAGRDVVIEDAPADLHAMGRFRFDAWLLPRP